MFDSTILVILMAAIAVSLGVLLGASQLLRTPWGRRVLLLAVVAVPVAVSFSSLGAGVQESSRTRFCLSCHEMQAYGKTLFADNRQALSATHYQNRLVDRDTSCYSCLTDYALFGDLKAKVNGLRHVWVHYLGKIPEKPALYQPYPNQNCLHCHDDARRFIEAPAHVPLLTALRSADRSCLSCHSTGHDFKAIAEHRFWGAQ